MWRDLFCLALILLCGHVYGQVSNDQILQRVQLKLNDDPIVTTTVHSTVEWKCIAKALTNKCLVYHNDQWFSFQVEERGTYYLNINNQQCKKAQGLQVIVIEGNPCEIKTYSILQCISKISQDDTFIELANIRPGTTYLLNIDGFLGDLCEFNIQLSSRPTGLPVQLIHSDSVSAQLHLNERYVHLVWKATPQLIHSIENFRVGRKSDQEAKNKWTDIRLKINAYGQPETDYSLSDTLTKQGTYTYMILGVMKDNGYPVLLHERNLHHFEKSQTSLSRSVVYFFPEFKKSATLEVVIFNAYTEAIVKTALLDYDSKKSKRIGIRTDELAEKGIKNFIVRVTNTKTRETKKFYFKLNEEGIFIPYLKNSQ
jgi:hypothetical protein